MREMSVVDFPQLDAARAILDAYIGGELDAAQASLQLTAPVVGGVDPDIESWLWAIWGAMMTVVRSIDCSDPAHDSLVALLASIRELPTPPRTPAFHAFERTWGTMSFWQDLPVFGPTVREDWNFSPNYLPEWQIPENVSSDFCTPSQWVSMNAFVARVFAAHVQDFSCYGIWSMRDAFEEALGHVVELDNRLPAAAVWVLYAGNLMYDLAQKAQPPDDIANASNGGPLWKGRIWYSLERWAFWKQGFSAAMGNSELDSWTREMAARTHQKMEQIEQQERETSHQIVASCDMDKGDASPEDGAD